MFVSRVYFDRDCFFFFLVVTVAASMRGVDVVVKVSLSRSCVDLRVTVFLQQIVEKSDNQARL